MIYLSYVSFWKLSKCTYSYFSFLTQKEAYYIYSFVPCCVFFLVYLRTYYISVLYLNLVHLSECKLYLNKNWFKHKDKPQCDVRAALKTCMVHEHLIWLIMVKQENNYKVFDDWEDQCVKIHIQNNLKVRFTIPAAFAPSVGWPMWNKAKWRNIGRNITQNWHLQKPKN